jgi:hypothetical protein
LSLSLSLPIAVSVGYTGKLKTLVDAMINSVGICLLEIEE